MPERSDPRPTPNGSWFNWWPAPVLTSGSVLLAFVLAVVTVSLACFGWILVSNGVVGLGALLLALLPFSAWGFVRTLRALRE